jgi:hypothetical protein
VIFNDQTAKGQPASLAQPGESTHHVGGFNPIAQRVEFQTRLPYIPIARTSRSLQSEFY